MKKILLLSLFLVSLCSCAEFFGREVEIRRYNDKVEAYVGNELMASYTGHILERYIGNDDKTVVIMYIDHNENYTEIRFPHNSTVIITQGKRTYKTIKEPYPSSGSRYELID